MYISTYVCMNILHVLDIGRLFGFIKKETKLKSVAGRSYYQRLLMKAINVNGTWQRFSQTDIKLLCFVLTYSIFLYFGMYHYDNFGIENQQNRTING